MKAATKARSQSGQCQICGCTDELACADGCCWVNEEHTLCSNEICVVVATREAALLKAVDLVLGAVHNRDDGLLSFVVPKPSLRVLARLRKRFRHINLGTREQQRRMREQGGGQ